ncbi:MAG: flippase [Anaerolineales bacterium]|nr:flippase [Anaerolineales bacterium]MCB8983682.1 flippase [Ardenticatenaceae bacterium]
MKTIAKNASALMVSQLMTWGLTLLLTLFLPRYLGPTAVGQFHFANSLWAIVAMLIAFGTDRYLVKEIARQTERAGELWGVTAVTQLLLYLLSFGGVAAYLALVGYAPETVQVVLVIGLGQLFWQWASAASSVLQGLEQMQYISVGSVAGKLFNTIVAITLLLLGYGVLVIAAVTIGAALVNLLVLLFYLRRAISLRPRFHWRAMMALLRDSSSYLYVRLALVVYQQVDIIIISLLVNEKTIGWYGAADQLFGTLLFIPTVFMTAVFPALSRLYTSDSDSLHRLMGKSFDLLLLVAIPIGLGLIVIANPLVVLLFGEAFAPSGPVLALFGVVLILTYQNMLLGQFLVSTDKQNRWTAVMVTATLATIPLDLLLIPWCVARFGNGALGGALAFIITETGMTIAGLIMLPRGALTRRNGWLAARIALAGALMFAAAWPLRNLFFLIPVAVGALVYLALSWLLRLLSPEETALLRDMRNRVFQKLGFSQKPSF